MTSATLRLTIAGLLSSPALVLAGGLPTAANSIEQVVVLGTMDKLTGVPISATEGTVFDEQLSKRPILRTGEMLEVVPGLIVTQHSGGGKANQFFLRGFNLDHGTDLATSVDGVPVNMPTHAHGHGYTDINFVIPELVQAISYRKGPYYAEKGDFSAAGAVDMRYRNTLASPLMQVEAGENNYYRGLLAGSTSFAAGSLLLAVDHSQSDGPWLLSEDFHKTNAVARYSVDTAAGRLTVNAQAYDGRWQSTDQIPERAVKSGQLDRFGFVDGTDGGDSSRYSVSVQWDAPWATGQLHALAYAVDYQLDLFSDFTYRTDTENGDQFEQSDDRRVYGGTLTWTRPVEIAGLRHDVDLGFDTRTDRIGEVGLYKTTERRRIATIREDEVQQVSYAGFATVTSHWSDSIRTSLGLRADRFDFDVDSDLAIQSGRASDSMLSPKFSLVLGPWRETEFFFNAGEGFHSNDARGTTIRVDPADQVTPVERVDPLVRALGTDVGFRTAIVPTVQVSASLWTLKLDSELLFVGDAGATEASRRSERSGVELAAIWTPLQWLVVDSDLAWSHSRFTDPDPAGNRIPGAVGRVASIGVAAEHPSGWFGGARFRHFGSASLIEDNSERSDPTTLVNVEMGYHFTRHVKASVAMFNVFDSEDNDITYFYESQLAGEAAPVGDRHFHPVEPRTLRVTLAATF